MTIYCQTLLHYCWIVTSGHRWVLDQQLENLMQQGNAQQPRNNSNKIKKLRCILFLYTSIYKITSYSLNPIIYVLNFPTFRLIQLIPRLYRARTKPGE